jgi:HK97 gp10 family phage protein
VKHVALEGFSELERKLEALPGKIAKRATGKAMRGAAKLVKSEIEIEAPRDQGTLAGSVKITLRNRNLTGLAEYADVMRAGGGIVAARGALRDARSGGNSAGTRVLVRVAITDPVAHLVEFGTVERFHKSGKSVGVMPANPFARRAWDNSGVPALNTIKTTLAAEVAKAAKEG